MVTPADAPARVPRFQTKQEFVYQTLRTDIMHGRLEPGRRLVIDDIARRFSVSPIPVREALQLLQSERLVDNVPHVGATVACISREAIVELFTVMEGLESVATRVAAERATPDEMDGLADLVTQMDDAVVEGDNERWADLNSRFHRAIVRLCGMPMLEEMTGQALDHWERVRRHFFAGVLVRRVAQAQQEHHIILKAMRARDYARLEQIVRTHLGEALRAYSTYLQRRETESPA